MRAIEELLGERAKAFRGHRLFLLLDEDIDLHTALPFAPGVAFWGLAFQDLLRLNESRVGDERLRRIARHHRIEDTGHDRWLFDDLRRLEVAHDDARWLFQRDHETTRAASYALLAEVFRAEDDLCRIVLLLALEAAGHVFFEQIASYLEGRGQGDLRYFGRNHLQAEKAHEMWERRVQEELFSLALDERERGACSAVVTRTFEAFDLMLRGIVAQIELRRQARVRAG